MSNLDVYILLKISKFRKNPNNLPAGYASAARKFRGTGDPSTKFILNEVKDPGQAPGRGNEQFLFVLW